MCSSKVFHTPRQRRSRGKREREREKTTQKSKDKRNVQPRERERKKSSRETSEGIAQQRCRTPGHEEEEEGTEGQRKREK